jgi:GNAT superfamily N-acetyltransferase
MFSNGVVLSGRKVELEDGAEIELWVEAGDDEVAVTAVEGQEMVARAAATRSRIHASAELSAWTAPSWRRRGAGRAAVSIVAEWALAHGVDYLTGAITEEDAAARSFLGHTGLIVSWRSDGHVRRFAAAPVTPAPAKAA